jgi:hypothetical protein
MNMATTTTVQRDDAAECREKFEVKFPYANQYRDGDNYQDVRIDYMCLAHVWYGWQAAWKAARGEV